jgi:hypothetical protein
MAGTTQRLAGPLALTTTTTTNIYNQSSSAIYDEVTEILVVNKTGAAATYSLWLGASGANAAGTEIAIAKTVAANSYEQQRFYPGLRMASTDFLVGGASANTTLTITVIGVRKAV